MFFINNIYILKALYQPTTEGLKKINNKFCKDCVPYLPSLKNKKGKGSVTKGRRVLSVLTLVIYYCEGYGYFIPLRTFNS